MWSSLNIAQARSSKQQKVWFFPTTVASPYSCCNDPPKQKDVTSLIFSSKLIELTIILCSPSASLFSTLSIGEHYQGSQLLFRYASHYLFLFNIYANLQGRDITLQQALMAPMTHEKIGSTITTNNVGVKWPILNGVAVYKAILSMPNDILWHIIASTQHWLDWTDYDRFCNM